MRFIAAWFAALIRVILKSPLVMETPYAPRTRFRRGFAFFAPADALRAAAAIIARPCSMLSPSPAAAFSAAASNPMCLVGLPRLLAILLARVLPARGHHDRRIGHVLRQDLRHIRRNRQRGRIADVSVALVADGVDHLLADHHIMGLALFVCHCYFSALKAL